jgi:hypothetical protein
MEISTDQSSSTPKIIAAIKAILVYCSCIAIAAGAIFYRAIKVLKPHFSRLLSAGGEHRYPTNGTTRASAGGRRFASDHRNTQ